MEMILQSLVESLNIVLPPSDLLYLYQMLPVILSAPSYETFFLINYHNKNDIYYLYKCLFPFLYYIYYTSIAYLIHH